MEFKEKLSGYVDRVEKGIDLYLPSKETRPDRLHKAMRHSMKAGGKRIRPVLILATSEMLQAETDAMPAAIAMECIHTYSLIHDDLPSIDNADLRRGSPTCHVAFDEATALLAGDALLTYAFQLLATHYQTQPELNQKLVRELSISAGSERLIGGQMEDILGEEKQLDASQLEYIHLNKTSALIQCSMVMGGYLGKASDEEIDSLRDYGRCIGLAFQVIDDILDTTSSKETLGKNVGGDEALKKTTYVSIHGIEEARDIANDLTQRAVEICHSLPGEASFLSGLAEHLNRRLN